MARKRASGVGSNSRRFAEIRRPDGSVDKVPAARDAATYLYLADANGQWPQRFLAKFLYDATWMVDGMAFELEDMRPGHGMGTVTTVQVIETQARVQIHPNGHGQVRRLVLLKERASTDALHHLTIDDLKEEA